jgi:hypothetical protein
LEQGPVLLPLLLLLLLPSLPLLLLLLCGLAPPSLVATKQ